jgi:hypothetical protein
MSMVVLQFVCFRLGTISTEQQRAKTVLDCTCGLDITRRESNLTLCSRQYGMSRDGIGGAFLLEQSLR